MSARTHILLAALAVLGAFAACSDDSDKSESRLIDRLCARDQCTEVGSGRRVQGLTPDSVGFELGPAQGAVVFAFPGDIEPSFASFAVEVLIEGEGGSSVGVLTPNYEWRRVPQGPVLEQRPSSARIDVSDGSHAKIADVRLIDLTPAFGECSVSNPGFVRRRRR